MVRTVRRAWLAMALVGAMLVGLSAFAATDRKVISKMNPAYPELARQLKVEGTVKIEVVIAADGTVKSLRALGGHPLLIQSASNALRKWRYAPGPETTTTIVEFHFHAN